MTEPTATREGKLFDRAAEVGYLLIPPSGDRWLLVDKTDDPGWSTWADLDEVEERLAAEENGNDGPDAEPPPGLSYGTPPWLRAGQPPEAEPGDPADPTVFGEASS